MSTPQDRLTHIDDAGAARMVDVSGKDVTARTARASGRVLVGHHDLGVRQLPLLSRHRHHADR
ncbi:hypothetical protein ABZ931_28670, partial [Streptomyces neyagawaensis]